MDYISRIKKLKNEKKITNEKLAELTGIPLGTSLFLVMVSHKKSFVNSSPGIKYKSKFESCVQGLQV